MSRCSPPKFSNKGGAVADASGMGLGVVAPHAASTHAVTKQVNASGKIRCMRGAQKCEWIGSKNGMRGGVRPAGIVTFATIAALHQKWGSLRG